MLFLLVQRRFIYSDIECFCFCEFVKRPKVFLNYFKVVHKEFISHFLLVSYSRFWSKVNKFKFTKFFNICRASIYVIISFLSIRKSSVLFCTNMKYFFGSTYIGAITCTSKFVAWRTKNWKTRIKKQELKNNNKKMFSRKKFCLR